MPAHNPSIFFRLLKTPIEDKGDALRELVQGKNVKCEQVKGCINLPFVA